MRKPQFKLFGQGRHIYYMEMDRRERLQMARLRTSKLGSRRAREELGYAEILWDLAWR